MNFSTEDQERYEVFEIVADTEFEEFELISIVASIFHRSIRDGDMTKEDAKNVLAEMKERFKANEKLIFGDSNTLN
jgi:polyhydroxyalkanoate synthesis regulator phasin